MCEQLVHIPQMITKISRRDTESWKWILWILHGNQRSAFWLESSYSLVFSKSDFSLLKAIYLTRTMFSSYRHFCFGAINFTFIFSPSFHPSQNEWIITPKTCILSSCSSAFHVLFPLPVQHILHLFCLSVLCSWDWPAVTYSRNLFMTTTHSIFVWEHVLKWHSTIVSFLSTS